MSSVKLILFYLVPSFLVYGAYTFVTYSKSIRDSSYYLPLGLAAAVLANVIWMFMARNLGTAKSIFYWGLALDITLTASTIIVPVMFFGVSPSKTSAVAIMMILTGIVLLKLSIKGVV